jgi:hypothetical protein
MAGPRSGPRDPGLLQPCVPGTDLGPDQIPQIYSNRLNFLTVPCPESSCQDRCFPCLLEEFLMKAKNLFRRTPPGIPRGEGDGGCQSVPFVCPEL